MRAGLLRHRVTLQGLVETQDPATGAITKSWIDTVTVWADVRFLSGLEAVKADAPVSVSRASMRIRYRPDVVTTMRAIHDGRTFDIKSVLPDTTGRHYLDLVIETGANNG